MVVGQLESLISGPVAFVLDSYALPLAPILQPVAESQGLHPVHFGIMMTVNHEISYLTPPMGLNLIVVAFWPRLSLFMIG